MIFFKMLIKKIKTSMQTEIQNTIQKCVYSIELGGRGVICEQV